MISLINKNCQSIAILVPVRRNDIWFQTSQKNNQICFVFFSKRFSFLQGVHHLPRRVVIGNQLQKVVLFPKSWSLAPGARRLTYGACFLKWTVASLLLYWTNICFHNFFKRNIWDIWKVFASKISCKHMMFVYKDFLTHIKNTK